MEHTQESALSQTIRLNQAGSITMTNAIESDDDINFLRAHGAIMVLIWMFCISTSILMARYFKKFLPEQKICGKAIWFTVHRSVMLFSAAMTLVAFAMILKYKEGKWTSKDLSQEFAHSIIGIIVISAVVIQPVMALFRCAPDAQYRYIFNYAHFIVGTTAFILSIVAIYVAVFFTRFSSALSHYWGILVAWLIVEFFIVIGFECLELCFRKNWLPFSDPNRDRPISMKDLDNGTTTDPTNPQTVANNRLMERIKSILLVFHIVTALGLSIALAVGIGQIS